MSYTKLISPAGDEVLVTETGVEGLKKNGYTEPKPAQKGKGGKKKDDDIAGSDAVASDVVADENE
jgi:hypothetical protein